MVIAANETAPATAAARESVDTLVSDIVFSIYVAAVGGQKGISYSAGSLDPQRHMDNRKSTRSR
jgi:hypothetical protein